MVYTEEEARRVIVQTAGRLAKAGLAVGTLGNISARISDACFAVTPSGESFGTLRPEDIVVVKIGDCSWEGERKPSSEAGIHADVYRLRPNINFVIHTHQGFASSWSVLGKNLSVADMISSLEKAPEQVRVLGGGIPCAAYGRSASRRLCGQVRRTVEEYPESRAVLMKNHGALCFGRDEDEAFGAAQTLEQVCRKEYENRRGIIFQTEGSSRGNYGSSLRKGSRVAFRLGKEKQVYRLGSRAGRDEKPEFGLHAGIYRHTKVNCVLHVRTPYVMAVSLEGKTLKPYLVDQARMVGTAVDCLPEECLNVSGTSEKRLLRALGGRNAVLIRNNGALCVGKTREEARAAAEALERGCQAALLAEEAEGAKPLGWQQAWLERFLYQIKDRK